LTLFHQALIELERGNNSKKLSVSFLSFSKERGWGELKKHQRCKTQQHKTDPCEKYLNRVKEKEQV
jgi:hypothetical protein